MQLPDGSTLDVFGSGGGDRVAEGLSDILQTDVSVLGRIPLDPPVREAADAGTPAVLSAPDSAAAQALDEVAGALAGRERGLAGMKLGLSPR